MPYKLLPMFPGIAYSPETSLTAAITADASEITIEDGTCLPDGPNWAVITFENSSETIEYSKRDGNVLKNIKRGVQEGGVGRIWPEGAAIARYIVEISSRNMAANIEKMFKELTKQSELIKKLTASLNELAALDIPTNANPRPETPITQPPSTSSLLMQCRRLAQTSDILLDDVDLNTLRQSGTYFISPATMTNGPPIVNASGVVSVHVSSFEGVMTHQEVDVVYRDSTRGWESFRRTERQEEAGGWSVWARHGMG